MRHMIRRGSSTGRAERGPAQSQAVDHCDLAAAARAPARTDQARRQPVLCALPVADEAVACGEDHRKRRFAIGLVLISQIAVSVICLSPFHTRCSGINGFRSTVSDNCAESRPPAVPFSGSQH